MAELVISIAALKRNTSILREVKEAAGCKLVLALKGFSCWKAFPFIKNDLDGCCASGIWEAQLLIKNDAHARELSRANFRLTGGWFAAMM